MTRPSRLVIAAAIATSAVLSSALPTAAAPVEDFNAVIADPVGDVEVSGSQVVPDSYYERADLHDFTVEAHYEDNEEPDLLDGVRLTVTWDVGEFNDAYLDSYYDQQGMAADLRVVYRDRDGKRQVIPGRMGVDFQRFGAELEVRSWKGSRGAGCRRSEEDDFDKTHAFSWDFDADEDLVRFRFLEQCLWKHPVSKVTIKPLTYAAGQTDEGRFNLRDDVDGEKIKVPIGKIRRAGRT